MQKFRVILGFLVACLLMLPVPASSFMGPVPEAAARFCAQKPIHCTAAGGAVAYYCSKHKVRCILAGITVTAIAVSLSSSSSQDQYICDDGRVCSRQKFINQIKAAVGFGYDVCEYYEECRTIFRENPDYKVAIAIIREFLRDKGAVAEDVNDGERCHKNVFMLEGYAPEAVRHIIDAQADGHPVILTMGNKNEAETQHRRWLAQKHHKQAYTGPPVSTIQMEWDEYPFASTFEGGEGASVRLISKNDNRLGGRIYNHQSAALPPGCKMTIIPLPMEESR